MTIAIHCHMDLSFLLGSWVVAGAPTRSTPDKFHGRLGRLVPETTPVVPMASIVSFVPSPEARCSTTVLVLWSNWTVGKHAGSMVQSAVFIHNRLRVLCNSLCFCWTKILVMFGLRSWALEIQILLASSIHKSTLTTVQTQPQKRYRKKYFFTTALENLPTSTKLGLPHFMPSTGLSRIVTGRHLLLATPCGHSDPCGPRARLLDCAAWRSSNGRCSWCRAGKAEATCDGHLDDLGQWVWVRTDY